MKSPTITDPVIGQVELQSYETGLFQAVGVIGEQHQGGEAGRADRIALGDGLGAFLNGCGNGLHPLAAG